MAISMPNDARFQRGILTMLNRVVMANLRQRSSSGGGKWAVGRQLKVSNVALVTAKVSNEVLATAKVSNGVLAKATVSNEVPGMGCHGSYMDADGFVGESDRSKRKGRDHWIAALFTFWRTTTN